MSTAILTAEAAALARITALVLDALPSPESRRAYGRALDDFLIWCRDRGAGFTKATIEVLAWRTKGRR